MDQGKHACRRWYCGYMKDSPPAFAGGLILWQMILRRLRGQPSYFSLRLRRTSTAGRRARAMTADMVHMVMVLLSPVLTPGCLSPQRVQVPSL